ncbi:MAG TPA: hypothetical protein VFZ65_00870 [Planctomycetota bacterium]|nr:hypothetical protein [Planctomycetota bacterium]
MPAPPAAAAARTRWPCLLLAVAGCASGELDPQWAAREPVVAVPASFSTTPELPAGFDGLRPDLGIEAGDEVLFGLRLDVGETRRDWFLRVAVESIDPSGAVYRNGRSHDLVHVVATVHDGAGELLGTEHLVLGRDHLERGLSRACRGEGLREGKGLFAEGPEDWPESFRATVALGQLLGVVRRSAILRGLLYEVVDPPSIWSVVLHLGVSMSTRAYFDEAGPADAVAVGDRTVPVWSLPHELLVNGDPALRSHILVTDPHSPLALCAGIVAITSVHPTDATRSFTMRLLSARRAAAK